MSVKESYTASSLGLLLDRIKAGLCVGSTVRMEAPPLQRKLAAILAADVEGYSRLMQVDEEQTLATLTSHRTDELIEKARGQIFGTAGDSVLAEFPSIVHAFHSAVAIQQAMWHANKELAFWESVQECDDPAEYLLIWSVSLRDSSLSWPEPALKMVELANTIPPSKSPSGRPCEVPTTRK